MFMIVFVLNDIDRLHDLLSAWDDVGVSGVTILYSTGLGHIRQQFGLRDDLPLFPNLKSLLEQEAVLNRTLFTMVETEEMVDQVVAVTQEIIGDLDQPNTGVLAVVPLARVYGIKRREGDQR